MDINIFKSAYKMMRSNSDEIYKGMGFKHLSEASQYYIHPNNESYDLSTTLCQSIGEAITLFVILLKSIKESDQCELVEYYSRISDSSFFLSFVVPEDFHFNGVIEKNISSYKAYLQNEKITISAYDEMGEWISGDISELKSLYKILPALCLFLWREIEINSGFERDVNQYVENPSVNIFVKIHEDFYQNNKHYNTTIEYSDLSNFDTDGMQPFSEMWRIIKSNEDELDRRATILTFAEDYFDSNKSAMIPNLGVEFELPDSLNGVCSAVTNGDAVATLLHGPAGTGKTISCKLICQAIGLPLLETINCTENLDEFILGKFLPQGGEIVFVESQVTQAIRTGGAVVFEEINFAKPQYLSFLNSLLDDNGFVRLDNGEVVRRHRDFRFFATMNLGYFGTKELNQSLYNRFNIVAEITELSDEMIERMLVTRVPECIDVVEKALVIYHEIKKKIELEELEVVISPRNLENWMRLAKYEGYVLAAEKTIIPVAKGDRELEKIIRNLIINTRWSL